MRLLDSMLEYNEYFVRFEEYQKEYLKTQEIIRDGNFSINDNAVEKLKSLDANLNNFLKNLEQKGIKANIAPNNTLILIYNYQFDSNVPQTSNTEFVATVRYK